MFKAECNICYSCQFSETGTSVISVQSILTINISKQFASCDSKENKNSEHLSHYLLASDVWCIHLLYSLTQTTLGESLPDCRRWLGHIRKSPAGLEPATGWMPPLLLSTSSTRLGQQHHLSVHTSEELPPPLARGSPSSVENFWMEKCLAHFRDRMDCSSCLL